MSISYVNTLNVGNDVSIFIKSCPNGLIKKTATPYFKNNFIDKKEFGRKHYFGLDFA